MSARITQLVRGFSSTWKQSVEALSQDVMRSFTNFKNGTSIIQACIIHFTLAVSVFSSSSFIVLLSVILGAVCLIITIKIHVCVHQGALTQLIQYYHGFHKILSQPTFRSFAVRSELINLHHLMVEVKKHKPNF